MKKIAPIFAIFCFIVLGLASWRAPEFMTTGSVITSYKYVKPLDGKKYSECMGVEKQKSQKQGSFGQTQGSFGQAEKKTEKKSPEYCSAMYWLGTDRMGIPLIDYATQGAKIVLYPSIVAGLLTCLFAVMGGLLRCLKYPFIDSGIQLFAEVVGALPRMVVILVCALILPRDMRGLLPLGIVWAILAAPTAMDEAGAVASRLGGARFVEALKAHGFGLFRIYIYHIVALNLRPVVVRQGSEVMMQVVFLEVALSYLAVMESKPSFTHADNLHSWADLLKMGYATVVVDEPSLHALVLGLGLITFIVVMASSISNMARAR